MVSFVILHYKNLKDTVECIESINKLADQDKISIVIVDNNSLNKEEEKILRKYTDDIIINDTNLGFAKANNIGSSYAIKKYHPDFLAVINNDIVIEQNDFIANIEKLYEQYKFDILGPKILPTETESHNPFPVYKTLEEVEAKIKYHKKLINIYQSRLKRFLLKLYVSRPKKNKDIINQNGLEDETNVGLHGCALIFSKKYYEKYNDVFFNDTFLYHEEEFLYLRSQKDNLITLYSPKIELIHKEGQSLNKEFKDDYKKLIFRNKEILKSLELLKKEMTK